MSPNQIKLFIVDNDPIFRLGFCTAIASYGDFAIVGQGDTSNDTFRQLTQGLVLNILVVGVGVDVPELEFSSLEFCERLRQLYPELPIFVLTPNFQPRQLTKIKSWGVKGYCSKGTNIEQVIEGLRRVAYGETYWLDRRPSDPNWLQTALSGVSQTGREQIQETIAEIDKQLENPDLSDWERVFLLGRKRELQTARWVTNRLLGSELPTFATEETALELSPKPAITEFSPPIELKISPVFADSITAKIFQRVQTDIQLGIFNRTNIPLELDILQPRKKQELLYTILERLGQTLSELRYTNFTSEEYLQSLWEWVTGYFFSQHYGELSDGDREQLTTIALQELKVIQVNIFARIHGASELFAYLLGEKSLTIDNIVYRSEAPEAIARAEYLLHNLIIQLANGVMQVILNNFSELEIFKYNLYDPNYKSSRELARFRNELSWRYRLETYWTYPQDIFESRYRLFILNQGRIKVSYIYAPRKQELDRLQGIPLWATIAIETRDAIAPRLRAIFSFAGSGVVFILTQVIGKGLGLIAKGILQGIGKSIK
ncbi:MAG: DUF3685 domain-containing protein [Pleurocapsa sp.]